ncbi:hypothetical protein OH77DRAFT_1156868 [Trametes cingulata]|nr:hypothetical protein OH77DRAFT_1156868 [Trametes cingulata]
MLSVGDWEANTGRLARLKHAVRSDLSAKIVLQQAVAKQIRDDLLRILTASGKDGDGPARPAEPGNAARPVAPPKRQQASPAQDPFSDAAQPLAQASRSKSITAPAANDEGQHEAAPCATLISSHSERDDGSTASAPLHPARCAGHDDIRRTASEPVRSWARPVPNAGLTAYRTSPRSRKHAPSDAPAHDPDEETHAARKRDAPPRRVSDDDREDEQRDTVKPLSERSPHRQTSRTVSRGFHRRTSPSAM